MDLKFDGWTMIPDDWKMFTTSREEIGKMLVDLGEVEIDRNAITIKHYPFEPSIAYHFRVLKGNEIDAIDIDSFPPDIQVGNELVFIPAVQKPELARFASDNCIPVIHRPDIWGWILEPFLDTEFTEARNKHFNVLLAKHGFGEPEVRSLRREVETQMLKYNFDTMLWEWISLGLLDVLKAMRAKYDKESFAVFFRRAMEIALAKPLSSDETP